jgi:DNA-binding response OmpR family regulator
MEVLLVPNDFKIRKGLQTLFEHKELEFLTAESVRHGIKLLDSHPSIDLVIVNISLQSESGLKLLQYLRQSPRYHWLPVIVMARNWNSSLVTLCADLKVNHMVAIPYTLELLEDKVQRALDNGKRRILLVEDDEALLELLKNIFELERFDTLGAGSCEEALEILANSTVHLIISDILLPKMTGLDLLKIVKKQNPEIPVVLATGYSGDYTRKDSLEIGADGYFKKPFKNTELVRKVRSLLMTSPVKCS